MKIHFIGIGGVSMSSLALILQSKGHVVTGSDAVRSGMTDLLIASGIDVAVGHAHNRDFRSTDLVVFTAAVGMDNPEIVSARACGVPVSERAELLGFVSREFERSVAVSGTHGKTTTCGMLAMMLEAEDPTIHIGGRLPSIGGNFRLGHSDVFVTEACEYHRSFLSLKPRFAVILNVDADHLDYYRDIADIASAFTAFARNADAVVVNGDDEWAMCAARAAGREMVAFGMESACDYGAKDIVDADGRAKFTLTERGADIARVSLLVPGRHNVANVLAATAAARLCGVEFERIISAIETFPGMDRRFQHCGMLNGAEVILDYAHHPRELVATIAAARAMKPQRLIVAFQPHTYTRTRALFDGFVDALSTVDLVFIAPIYAAREKNTGEVCAESLANAVRKRNHACAHSYNASQLISSIKSVAAQGDMILILGAGDIADIVPSLTNRSV